MTEYTIPYSSSISQRFIPGKSIKIQGTVPNIAYRFDINLQCGPQTTPRDDIALQVAFCILDGYISLNYLQNGVWGEELRRMSMPIKRATKFDIEIFCEFSEYKVLINGEHYCDLPQKIHYDRISHLTIEGDVSIIQITYGSASGTILNPPLSTVNNEDFQMINKNLFTTPPSGITPAHGIGFSTHAPPSYDNAMQKEKHALGTAPYPVGSSYSQPYSTSQPAVVSYPIAGSPYANSAHPYPAPLNAPTATHQSGYPPSVPPLNADRSFFTGNQGISARKVWIGFLIGFGVSAFFVIMIFNIAQ